MPEMRLIKKQGSRIDIRDRAFVLFNSYERGSVMGYVERFKRCPDCRVRASVRCLWRVNVQKDDDLCGEFAGEIEICSNCIKRLMDDGYDVWFDDDDGSDI